MALALESSTEIVMDVPAHARSMPDELVKLPPLESWRLERSYAQRSRVHGRERSFTLFNGHYLELRERVRKRERRAIFNLAFLDPAPLHYRRFAWRWLGATLAAVLGAAGAFWAQALITGAGLLALAVLLGFQVLRRSRDQLVFRTLSGRVPAFALDLGLVGRRESREFAGLLSERMEGARTLLPAGRDRLAVEVAEHRRLAESGVITRRGYEKAKQRIFSAVKRPRKR